MYIYIHTVEILFASLSYMIRNSLQVNFTWALGDVHSIILDFPKLQIPGLMSMHQGTHPIPSINIITTVCLCIRFQCYIWTFTQQTTNQGSTVLYCCCLNLLWHKVIHLRWASNYNHTHKKQLNVLCISRKWCRAASSEDTHWTVL